MTILPSIFDTVPTDMGGIHARRGFAYQDAVAVSFYLQMLSTPELMEVSCETYDDILLLWLVDGIKIVEFIQVKAENPDQLWTVAKLCNRPKSAQNSTGIGTSILEKSLARDQYIETSWFRIVTSRQVDPNLAMLIIDRGQKLQSLSSSTFDSLKNDIGKRLSGFISKKGNDYSYWLYNACWSVFAEDAINHANLYDLNKALFKLHLPYDPDTVRGIYDSLRTLAKTTAEYGINKWDQKRITRDILITKIKNWIDPYPGTDRAKRLEQKFRNAGLDNICLNVAKDQQRFYTKEKRAGRYFTTEQAEDVDQKVLDKLSLLRASLDSGKINLNGIQFHEHCLREVRQLQTANYLNTLNPSYLTGCIYEITSRCRHRFTRLL